MELTLKDQAVNAIKTLYGTTRNPELANEANAFLMDFQTKVDAWFIADALLRDPEYGLEVKTFMALTLKVKVKKDLIDLDVNSRLSLRDSLIQIIESHRQAPELLLNTLNLALVNLVIQLKEWENPVIDLIQKWSNDNVMCKVLMMFLTLLPQEISQTSIFKTLNDREFRDQANKLLVNNSAAILGLLTQVMKASQSDLRVQEKNYQCLNAWMKSGDIALTDLSDGFLINETFNALVTQPELFDVTADVICELIYETREVNECMEIIQIINSKFSIIKSFLSRDDHDEETLKAIMRILTSACEAYEVLIADHPQSFVTLIDSLLIALKKCPIYSLAYCFDFFYSFTQLINEKGTKYDKGVFASMYASTLNTLIARLQLPREDSDWSKEEMDNFKDFRYGVGDILKDCTTVLGGDTALSIPYAILEHQLQRSPDEIKKQWQEVEAVLFSFRSIGSEVTNQDVMITKVFELFPKLPAIPRVRFTATMIIACYAKWTSHHPNVIPFQLSYAVDGMVDNEVSAASTLSLYKLARHCGKHLTQHLPVFIDLYNQYETKLHYNDLLNLSGAIGNILYYVPYEQYGPAITQIINPVLLELQNAGLKKEHSPREIANINFQLQRLTKLYIGGLRSFSQQDVCPAMPIIEQSWGILDQLLYNFNNNEELCENICHNYATIIKCLGSARIPFMPAFATKILEIFQLSAQPILIWVINKMISVYYKSNLNECLELFEKCSYLVFQLAVSHQNFDAIPKVIQDFSELILATIDEIPAEFLQSNATSTILQYLQQAINMQEHQALESVLICLVTILGTLSSQLLNDQQAHFFLPLLKHVTELSPGFTNNVIRNSLSYYNRDLLDISTDILGFLAELNPTEAVNWVRISFLSLEEETFLLKSGSTPNQLSPVLIELLENLERDTQNNDFLKYREHIFNFIQGYRYQMREEKKRNQQASLI